MSKKFGYATIKDLKSNLSEELEIQLNNATSVTLFQSLVDENQAIHVPAVIISSNDKGVLSVEVRSWGEEVTLQEVSPMKFIITSSLERRLEGVELWGIHYVTKGYKIFNTSTPVELEFKGFHVTTKKSRNTLVTTVEFDSNSGFKYEFTPEGERVIYSLIS